MIEKEKLFNDNINIAYKIAHQYKKNYTFTYKEILIALGYSPDTSTTSISNIIDSFCREGILEVEEKYDYIEKHGEIHKIPVKEL